MTRYDEAAGHLLRHFRVSRGFTQQEAARRLNASAPVLSRNENGVRAIKREDIRAAIQAYDLTPWEGYCLWLAGGFVPEREDEPQSHVTWPQLGGWLETVDFPALVVDALGFMRAWNQGWSLCLPQPPDDQQRPHYLHTLLSPPFRQHLNDHWQPLVVTSIRRFVQRGVQSAAVGQVCEMMEILHQRHPDLASLWEQAHQAPQDPSLVRIQLQWDGTAPVRFLGMETTLTQPQPLGLVIFTPQSSEDEQSYRAALARARGLPGYTWVDDEGRSIVP